MIISSNFNINDNVKITILENLKGRVVALYQSEHGITYKVRYFWECSVKEVYFYEDEIEHV